MSLPTSHLWQPHIPAKNGEFRQTTFDLVGIPGSSTRYHQLVQATTFLSWWQSSSFPFFFLSFLQELSPLRRLWQRRFCLQGNATYNTQPNLTAMRNQVPAMLYGWLMKQQWLPDLCWKDNTHLSKYYVSRNSGSAKTSDKEEWGCPGVSCRCFNSSLCALLSASAGAIL